MVICCVWFTLTPEPTTILHPKTTTESAGNLASAACRCQILGRWETTEGYG